MTHPNPPQQRPPLILLHGNFASPRWWEPVRGHLPGDVPVLAPDMRAWVDDGRVTITTFTCPPWQTSARTLGGQCQGADRLVGIHKRKRLWTFF